MKKLIFIFSILFIIAIFLYQNQNKIDIKLTNIIGDELEFEPILQVCFQTLPSTNNKVKRQSFIISSDDITKEEETYTVGCYQNYSDSLITELSKKLGYDTSAELISDLGQVYMYRKYEEFSLYVLEGERLANKMSFNVIIENDTNAEVIKISHLPGERIDSIYKDNSYIYLFYKSAITNNICFYTLNANTYEYQLKEISVNENLNISFDNMILENNKLYVIYEQNNIFIYNIETQKYYIENFNELENISYIFYSDKTLYVIGLDKYTNINMIKYNCENKEYETVNMGFEKYVKNYNISPLRHFYFYNNMIYGMLSGSSRTEYAMFIYNITNEKIIYLSKIYSNNNGYSMVDNTWMYKNNNDYIYMK